MKLGSLFSGYGGLDQAVHAVFPGAETRWVSDIESGPCKILAHRYPDVPNLGDITRINWADVEPVDIIAGGSPCQDLSTAGKRAGMRTGTRSGLWESMREAIAIIKPAFVVWENVLGALSAEANSDSELEFDKGPLGGGADGSALRAIGRVLGDLSSLGYDSQWTVIRASDVGAPHHRARVFLLGVRQGVEVPSFVEPGVGTVRDNFEVLPTITTQDTDAPVPSQLKRNTIPLNTLVVTLPTPNTMDTLPARSGEAREKALRRGGETSRRESTGNLREEIAHLPTVDTNGDNRRTSSFSNDGNNFYDIVKDNQWGKYAEAIHRWEHTRGVPAPDPTVVSPSTGRPVLSPMFTEWMMGLPTGWITDVPGITRTEAIRACGNGVVPQQAAAALRELLQDATLEAPDVA